MDENTLLEETLKLFPDFDNWESAPQQWEPLPEQPPVSPLVESLMGILPQIQEASTEDRLEAIRVLLG